jgi:hypothetical protein
LPKRGKERENFPKEGEGKGRNGPLDYAKTPFCGLNLKKEESFHSFLKSGNKLPYFPKLFLFFPLPPKESKNNLKRSTEKLI